MKTVGIFLLRVTSVIAFGLALGLAIPPVPSDPSTKYSFFPAGLFAAAAFVYARAIEKKFPIAWWQIACEVTILCLVVYLILMRVEIPPIRP